MNDHIASEEQIREELRLLRAENRDLKVLIETLQPSAPPTGSSDAQQLDIDARIHATHSLLRLMNTAASRKEYLDALVERIRKWSGCRCVGIRILNAYGEIPFESYIGFSQNFWESENWLVLSHDCCICTRVITGTLEEHESSCTTANGSFYCNQSKAFIDALPREGQSHYRARCIRAGFASLAVMPIRYNGDTVGAIHLADERADQLPASMIDFLEALTPVVGEAIHKYSVRDRIQQHYETQSVIAQLLRLSLAEISLEEILDRALGMVLSIPWLAFGSTGAIFLTNADRKSLSMSGQRGLSPEVAAACGRVPIGECLCGKAAQTGKIQFCANAGEHPGLKREIPAHGHYCVPIMVGERPLGVMSIHVRQGHHQDPREEELLLAVADALAGIITRKQMETALRASEEKYRELVENANSIILRIDPRGTVTFVNGFAQRLFGFSEAELIGRPILGTILPERDSTGRDVAAMLQEFLANPEAYGAGESENRLRDGRTVWIFWTIRAIYDAQGQLSEILSVGNDVTERKRAGEALERYSRMLEQSNRELQEFAYVASHDLQEPLRKIQAFGERLKTHFGEALGDKGQDYIDRMQNASQRMQQLIQALLGYSRVSTQTEPFSPVDLNRIAKEVTVDLETRIEQTNAEIEIAELPTIEADPNQMRQLFQNLLSNALKFHGADPPHIHVAGRPLPDGKASSEEKVQLIFADNGIGFDEKYLDRIFAPFQRLHGRNAYEGTGMGLAICRKIVERHSGNITAKSTPGQGSTFIVTLPRRHGPAVDSEGDQWQSD